MYNYRALNPIQTVYKIFQANKTGFFFDLFVSKFFLLHQGFKTNVFKKIKYFVFNTTTENLI